MLTRRVGHRVQAGPDGLELTICKFPLPIALVANNAPERLKPRDVIGDDLDDEPLGGGESVLRVVGQMIHSTTSGCPRT